MAIPDYQTLMLPLLQLASDLKEHQLRAVTEMLADEFALSIDGARLIRLMVDHNVGVSTVGVYEVKKSILTFLPGDRARIGPHLTPIAADAVDRAAELESLTGNYHERRRLRATRRTPQVLPCV
jgi:hypothetical protein